MTYLKIWLIGAVAFCVLMFSYGLFKKPEGHKQGKPSPSKKLNPLEELWGSEGNGGDGANPQLLVQTLNKVTPPKPTISPETKLRTFMRRLPNYHWELTLHSSTNYFCAEAYIPPFAIDNDSYQIECKSSKEEVVNTLILDYEENLPSYWKRREVSNPSPITTITHGGVKD